MINKWKILVCLLSLSQCFVACSKESDVYKNVVKSNTSDGQNEIIVERLDVSNIIVERDRDFLQDNEESIDNNDNICVSAELSPVVDGDATLNENENQECYDLTEISNIETVLFDMSWPYSEFSKIHSGNAVMYRAKDGRKNIVIGVNAGHGTSGGTSVKTYCHPDMSPKVTGGTTSAGSITAVAVSGGMTFLDGTSEATVTLKMAEILRDKLLLSGYDVLMLRDGDDVQLDNIARTVIANNVANCIISLHWDGDNLDYDKGCFYISTPDGIKNMEPVASHWQEHEALGNSLISGLKAKGCKIYQNGSMKIDLTQTSFSTVASVDIELGNAASIHDVTTLNVLAEGLVEGIEIFYR